MSHASEMEIIGTTYVHYDGRKMTALLHPNLATPCDDDIHYFFSVLVIANWYQSTNNLPAESSSPVRWMGIPGSYQVSLSPKFSSPWHCRQRLSCDESALLYYKSSTVGRLLLVGYPATIIVAPFVGQNDDVIMQAPRGATVGPRLHHLQVLR